MYLRVRLLQKINFLFKLFKKVYIIFLELSLVKSNVKLINSFSILLVVLLTLFHENDFLRHKNSVTVEKSTLRGWGRFKILFNGY